jgi:hypothetical protein
MTVYISRSVYIGCAKDIEFAGRADVLAANNIHRLSRLESIGQRKAKERQRRRRFVIYGFLKRLL